MKVHCLPFAKIPHTTRLFSDFLGYSPSLHPFFPHSRQFPDWMREESENLSYDASRRQAVADILERQNKSWHASPQTLANLDRLRKGASAIVTGQQVGLFGGPTFSIYKALTAVKLAEEATSAGVDAVPVFWLATYDHDLAEVNHVSLPQSDGSLETLAISSQSVPGAPVSTVRLGDEILPVLEQAALLLGDTEATTFLCESYVPGETLGTAFARLYGKLFADHGVIVLDASDGALHKIAEPVYRAAISRGEELTDALLARGEALEAAGYHQQVKVTHSSTLLFTLRDGVRMPIHRHPQSAGTFSIGSEDAFEKISEAELLDRLAAKPEQFSPNVLLRPIVQDFLLPTIAYTGGAAEVAYFAQAGAVYEILLGRVTPIVPRYSATIVEPKLQRLLERYGLTVLDVFTGADALRQTLASQSLPADLQAAFDHTRKTLDSNLSVVIDQLARLDRTLVDAAETSRSKIQHQLEKLHAQAARAELQKAEVVGRHAEILSQALYPDKGLQERAVAGIYFMARYGRGLLDLLRDSMRPDCHEHRIVEFQEPAAR